MFEFIAGAFIGVMLFIIFIAYMVSKEDDKLVKIKLPEIERGKSLAEAEREKDINHKIDILADYLGLRFTMSSIPFFMTKPFLVAREIDNEKLPANREKTIRGFNKAFEDYKRIENKLNRLFDYLNIEEKLEPGEPAKPAKLIIKKKSK